MLMWHNRDQYYLPGVEILIWFISLSLLLFLNKEVEKFVFVYNTFVCFCTSRSECSAPVVSDSVVALCTFAYKGGLVHFHCSRTMKGYLIYVCRLRGSPGLGVLSDCNS